MKENSNVNASASQKQTGDSSTETRPAGRNGRPNPYTNGHAQTARLDAWTVLDLLGHRWHWLVLGALIGGAAFYLLGWHFVRSKFTATAELLRYEAPGKSEFFKTTPVSSETFSGIMRSPDLLRAVGEQIIPPVPPETLTKLIKIDPEEDSDLIKVQLAARDPQQAVSILNSYTEHTVEFMRNLEKAQAGRLANEYLKKQVTEMNGDIEDLNKQFRSMPASSTVTSKLVQVGGQLSSMSTNLAAAPQPTMVNFSQQAQRLQTAVSELQDLLVKYTDLNPLVVAKRGYIKDLERQVQQVSGGTNLAATAMGGALTANGSALTPELDIIHIKLRALEDSRLELLKRQREAELYASDPPGTVRIFAPANLQTVRTNLRPLKVSIVTVFGALIGIGAGLVLVFLVEFFDNRLKTVEDVHRVTKLPVLTTLGDLHLMKPEDRAQWAFRAWTMLQGRLSPSPNFGLVCGITSSAPGEGRSTWISLLAEAASMTGFRVLTIATRPSPTHLDPDEPGRFESLIANFGKNDSEARPEDDGVQSPSNSSSGSPSPQTNGNSHPPGTNGKTQGNALTTSVLTSPSQVTAQLTGPNSQPVVHIPLPGWVWNLDRRKQWKEALDHWRQIDNLVILVELPPADVPEAVLLGSNLPNMLWLSHSGVANAADTRAQLETLRDARCNLVGAVLNREQGLPLRKRFPRWMGCLAAFAALGLLSAQAQNNDTAQPTTGPGASDESTTAERAPHPGWFSIVSPAQKADWQKHLTLGPGDSLNLSLYGQPELSQIDVPVGPDGRLNYLEATNVVVTGLTVDELRAKLDEQLSLYRRSPRTIVVPVSFKSKKYFMLGKVATKGVYTLDRPLTVLEALARAHGLESALVDRTVVSLTDFQRSFLARGGKRYPLNFEKLFQQGDLSQNIAVEPDDYIYFAPGDVNEVYVVGEVRLPGTATYTPDMTVIAAISARGGYTDRAFKMRVLVIRGSLQNPERFVVNTHAILDGKEPNFKLQPRDVVFVNSRPFIKVEEAADLAATAFIQSVITSWVGVRVVPIQ
jgi:protein involved in polysaccharide export with SLBB domain/capsular polysaccharide biosynthesis protein